MGVGVEFVAGAVVGGSVEVEADGGPTTCGGSLTIVTSLDLVDGGGEDAEEIAAGEGAIAALGDPIGMCVAGRSLPDVIGFLALKQRDDRPGAVVVDGGDAARCPGDELNGEGKVGFVVEGFDRPAGGWIRRQWIEIQPGGLFEQLLDQRDDPLQLRLWIVRGEENIFDVGEEAVEPIGPIVRRRDWLG